MRFTSVTTSLTWASTTLAMLWTTTGSAIEPADRKHSLGRLNEARMAKGRDPLSWSSSLAHDAQYHADEIGCGAEPPDFSPLRTRPFQGETVYKEKSAICEGQPHRRTLESAMNFWLIAKDRPNTEPEDQLYYDQCMAHEAVLIGCGQSYDHKDHCTFYTVCRFSPGGISVVTKDCDDPDESEDFCICCSKYIKCPSKHECCSKFGCCSRYDD